MYLSRAQLNVIARRWHDYAWATRRANLPGRWAFALVGMHYNESALKDDAAGEAGGPFCLDRGTIERNRAFVEAQLKTYTHAATDKTLETDFVSAALVAAAELKLGARQPIASTDADLGLALARYNGFPRQYNEKWQTGSGSDAPSPAWHPYVSNDPQRGFILKCVGGSTIDGAGVRHEIPVHFAENPGALVIAREVEARWSEWYAAGLERPDHPEFA